MRQFWIRTDGYGFVNFPAIVGALLIIYVYPDTIKAVENKYVSKTKESWEDKESVCVPAVFPMSYTEKGFTVDVNETLDIEDDTGAWVGYVETFEIFEYIGCINETNDQLDDLITQRLTNVSSPGYCYSLCGQRSVFGLFQEECLCLNTFLEKADTRNSQCNTECLYQKGVACGGLLDDGLRLISVYKHRKRLTGTKNDAHENSLCLGVTQYSKHFAWLNCSDIHNHICFFPPSTYIPTSSDASRSSWMMNVNLCWRQNGMSLSIQDYSNVDLKTNKTNDLVWTNVIRSRAITLTSTHDRVPQTNILYGFVVKNGYTYLLNFTDDKTTKKKILCDRKATEARNGLGHTMLIIIGCGVTIGLGILVAMVILIIMQIRKKRIWFHVRSFYHKRNRDKIPSINDDDNDNTGSVSIHLHNSYDYVRGFKNGQTEEMGEYVNLKLCSKYSNYDVCQTQKKQTGASNDVNGTEEGPNKGKRHAYDILRFGNDTDYDTTRSAKRAAPQDCEST